MTCQPGSQKAAVCLFFLMTMMKNYIMQGQDSMCGTCHWSILVVHASYCIKFFCVSHVVQVDLVHNELGHSAMDLFWECNRDLPCVRNLHALRQRCSCCICLVHGYDAGDVTRAHAQARASGAARQLEPNSNTLHMCDESVQCRQSGKTLKQGRSFRVQEAA